MNYKTVLAIRLCFIVIGISLVLLAMFISMNKTYVNYVLPLGLCGIVIILLPALVLLYINTSSRNKTESVD